jgi:IS605 OrfB family transposase
MKLTQVFKLQPTEQQAQFLLVTMERFNAACNFVSETAFTEHIFGQIKLHHLCYYAIREKFGLSSQMAVRVIGKVSDSYKTEKKHLHTFKPHGAIVYDQRILTFKFPDCISVLTLDGREIIPFVFKNYRELDIRRVRGQADLLYRDGEFYLAVCVELPDRPTDENTDWLGVDLGVVNIAADSTGKTFSGAKVNALRKRHAKLRGKLQSKGTKSAKRLRNKRRHKEQLFAKDVNHCISKKIVAKAKGTLSGIALEDLKGIRDRVTVRKAQRRQHSSWSFNQLRQFIEYKAMLDGVAVKLVDPRNTSRTCPNCGNIDKKNRPDQATFKCTQCGFSGRADYIAAINIGRRAAVNQPNVGIAS